MGDFKRIALFGGSFNPIHIGHVALAEHLVATERVDEVWFLVSPHNPLKTSTDLLPDEERLALVECAIMGCPHFRDSDFEFRLPKPSYMYTTLTAIKEAYPDCLFHLLIGADNWLCFDKWHCGQQICDENAIFIYPRPGYPLPDPTALPPTVELIADAPTFDLSSTFIREALQQGRDVRRFLHPAVYEKLTQR